MVNSGKKYGYDFPKEQDQIEKRCVQNPTSKATSQKFVEIDEKYLPCEETSNDVTPKRDGQKVLLAQYSVGCPNI